MQLLRRINKVAYTREATLCKKQILKKLGLCNLKFVHYGSINDALNNNKRRNIIHSIESIQYFIKILYENILLHLSSYYSVARNESNSPKVLSTHTTICKIYLLLFSFKSN